MILGVFFYLAGFASLVIGAIIAVAAWNSPVADQTAMMAGVMGIAAGLLLLGIGQILEAITRIATASEKSLKVLERIAGGTEPGTARGNVPANTDAKAK